MAVTGAIHPERVIRNVGVREGDALVLTKRLGTGIITTALKRRKAPAASVRAAVASMISLNKAASGVMRKFRVHACSDVTGYGLLGHTYEMADGSGVTVVLESAKLPLLPGVARLAARGYLTGGCKRNRTFLDGKIAVAPSVSKDLEEIAFDPQTSGGLLIALPKEAAPRLVKALRAARITAATVVGTAIRRRKVRVELV
jgi:selenide,water dikinase